MFVSPVFDFLLIGRLEPVHWRHRVGRRPATHRGPRSGDLAARQDFARISPRRRCDLRHPGRDVVLAHADAWLSAGLPGLVFTAAPALADWLVRYVSPSFCVVAEPRRGQGRRPLDDVREIRVPTARSPMATSGSCGSSAWHRSSGALLRPQGGIGVTLKHLGVSWPRCRSSTCALGVSMGLSAVALAAPLVFVLLRRRGRTLPTDQSLGHHGECGLVDGVQLHQCVLLGALFHGVQYLAIAALFHVREQTRRPGNRRGWAFHVGIFYGASVALAYVLFVLWPDATSWAGTSRC